MQQHNSNSGILFALCNPLLDISVTASQELLDRYHLKRGTAILASQEHLPLYDEIVKYPHVEYTAGGASQNTARACQWMLGQRIPRAVTYVGCVGNDDNGRRLKTIAESDGVAVHYLVTDKERTGTCAVLINDKERTLVANLGAANLYNITHLETKEIQDLIERAKFFYVTGFFLTVSPQSLNKLGQHACQNNKVFVFNIAAPFLIEHFFDKMMEILPYADIVLGNEHEGTAFGQKMNWGDDLKVIAQKLANLPKKNTKRKRIVVFTQGARNTIVFYDDKLEEIAPPYVPPEEIVDVNGAGDSFAGGFMAGLILGKPIEECVRAGHYCASEVIRRSGCTFPRENKFVWSDQTIH
jgi:adenosine kinase